MRNLSAHLKSYILLSGYLFFVIVPGYAQPETVIPDTANERLENIGNHKLFISEKGSPGVKFTIVFISGAGGSSKDWTKVKSMLPPAIRTVAYDRAGMPAMCNQYEPSKKNQHNKI